MAFRSDRTFKLWDYNVSHQQLLLRSPRTPDLEKNVDVVFWGVEFIEMPTALAGIEIVAGDVNQVAAANLWLKRSIEAQDVYSIDSYGKRFLVVAKGFKVLENSLDIFDSALVDFAADRPIEEYGVVLAHSGGKGEKRGATL